MIVLLCVGARALSVYPPRVKTTHRCKKSFFTFLFFLVTFFAFSNVFYFLNVFLFKKRLENKKKRYKTQSSERQAD